MTKMRPISFVVLVDMDPEDDVTPGGIAIPDVAKKKKYHQTGIAVDVGPGRISDKGVLIPMQIKKGERVIFDRGAGMEILVGNKKYVVVPENKIVGVLEE